MKATVLKRFFLISAGVVLGAMDMAAQYTLKVPQDENNNRDSEVKVVRSFAAPAGQNNGLKTLYLNKFITTFITTGDNIKLMDLSLPGNVIAGNQPGENIARIKPIKEMDNGEDMGILTIVGERSLTQFNLRYVTEQALATSQFSCSNEDGNSYLNPAVDMTQSQMYEYAWTIMNSSNKFYNVSTKVNRMKMRLNNIYSSGNYFFIDVSLENRTNIPFSIEEIRIKVADKKKVKRTNNQEIEVVPTLMVNNATSFKKQYRNVFVLPKLTFPDEKVLTITIAEKQISGRTITLSIDYSDVLCADAFDNSLM